MVAKGETRDNDINNEGDVSITQSEDFIVRVEYVKKKKLLLGLKVELINLSEIDNLVLYIPDDINNLFCLNLIDTEGLNVSPMRSNKKTHPRKKKYNYISISPNNSHSWFLSIPQKIRNPRELEKKSLTPILRGRYELQLQVSGLYYLTQEKNAEVIDKYPNFKKLNLELPKIEIEIDPEYLQGDVIREYIDNTKGTS